MYGLGLGFYHSGVVVNGKLIQLLQGAEHSFGTMGIGSGTPREIDHFRETIFIGNTIKNYQEINNAIYSLRSEFPSGTYHPILK